MPNDLKQVNLFDTNQAFLGHIPENNEIDFVNIKNDNTFKTKVAQFRIPDYTAGVAVSVSTTTTYTCPSNGIIIDVDNNSSTQVTMKVNNISIGGQKLYNDQQLIVNKGDVISMSAGSTTNLRFFPFKI